MIRFKDGEEEDGREMRKRWKGCGGRDPLMPGNFSQWISRRGGRGKKGNILAMKEATGIQFRGQKGERMLSAWFAPKRRGFSLSKHLALGFRRGIYLTGKLDNRIQPLPFLWDECALSLSLFPFLFVEWEKKRRTIFKIRFEISREWRRLISPFSKFEFSLLMIGGVKGIRDRRDWK